ncbi:sodium:solute symporter family protein [Ruficoccus amylovorans]|uniref:Sodium:solute symporter family protein n=1 Tax=Ruficoccus amylovorans TaxID=1804625 RepID=A0A842HIC7_9BACT|nr:sodium:solute symporter family protein [Ruficoccus amylovorans]MBC2595910.1 sodium:solute symporter family protein [Ruficoccus amylovorans]
MNFTTLDWAIILAFLVFLFLIALYAKSLTRSVSDFLAANRCAGRYLLTLADGMAALGAIAIIANFEKFYKAGFGGAWWGMMMAPVAMIIALSGWVVYRYRKSQAMTMAQLFEMRYSRGFRVYAGILAWVSGILNYGVFPGITALFLIHFCGLPENFEFLGFIWQTKPVIMFTMLGIAVCFTLFGGLIAVMVTDFFQSSLLNISFITIFFILIFSLSWENIGAVLKDAPQGMSMLNPFDQHELTDFNVWFFLIFAFKLVYNCLGWQGNQGYNAAAKSPHEAKMARVLGEWRNGITYMLMLFAPICAYVLLNGGGSEELTHSVNATLDAIGDPQTQEQMRVPVLLSAILPVGVLGIFGASILAAAISTDDTQLHSWGSIFIQDVVLPFRKKALSPKSHLRLLRLSVLGVAAFAFLWSLYFPLKDYLLMYFLLTGTIYLGGSGAVIIGGLYWKRGTTQGAWVAMTTGWVIAAAGITLQQSWDHLPALTRLAPEFPLNGAYIAMISYLASIVSYVAVSLLTCRKPFPIREMLRADDSKDEGAKNKQIVTDTRNWLHRMLNFNREYTRGDRAIYYLQITWTMGWLAVFLVGTLWGLITDLSNEAWLKFWKINVYMYAAVASITVVWFVLGGCRDIVVMVRKLKTAPRDDEDDGTVYTHLAESSRVEVAPPPDTGR